tara:strand:- start:467 stop:1165 length:699 start_codon:yes stop_codon:yes gene_type:complete
MILSTKAIVFNSIKYGDKSLISKLYTEDRGLISIISPLKKGKKENLRSYFQPLNCIKVTYYAKSSGTIKRLKEVSHEQSVRKESVEKIIQKNAIKFFIAEVLLATIKEEEENKALFNLLWKNSEALNVADYVSNFHIYFLNEYIHLLGIQPNTETEGSYFDYQEAQFVVNKPRHEQYETQDLKSIINKVNLGKLDNRIERNKLLRFYVKFLNYQTGALTNLKSLDILEEVFA